MVRAAALVLFGLLAGCADEKARNICSAEYPARIAYAPAIDGPQVRENANRCVQHWAARFSLSRDSATEVARAALGACREGLDEAKIYSEADAEPFDWKAYESRMMELALYRAVQQRAGDCGIPELGEMPLPEKGRIEAKTQK